MIVVSAKRVDHRQRSFDTDPSPVGTGEVLMDLSPLSFASRTPSAMRYSQKM